MIAERLFSCKEAKSIWVEKIRHFGINPTIHWHGLGKWQSAFCYLEKDGCLVAKGVGKGIHRDQVELSSLYEAIENYLSHHHLHQREIIFKSVNDICKEFNTLPYRYDKRLLSANENPQLPWVIANHIQTKKPIAIPLTTVDCQYFNHRLSGDNCDYYQYHCYASTNGLVSAATYEDALIHGISEVIERDAISYFLLDTFLLNEPIHVVIKATLPDYLQTLISELEILYQDNILLVQLPSRFGVPVFSAIFTEKKLFGILPKGFGASLNACYAAERAILEALQTLHVYECMPEERIDLSTTDMSEFPILLKCLSYDLSELIDAKQFQTLNFINTPYMLETTPIGDYLTVLLNKVNSIGLDVFVNDIVLAADGFSCVNVVIPGTEEFFHVFNERIVLPQQQTVDYITSKHPALL